MTSLTAQISLRNVSFNYQAGETEIIGVNCVNFDFERDSSYSIVGRSGSGKSTLVTLLTLLRHPQTGEILMNGLPVSLLSAKEIAIQRSNIGIVFQRYHIDDNDTVMNNVLFPVHFLESRNQIDYESRARDVLKWLGLKNETGRKAATLSGGQRQRVAIARSLITMPTIIVADEPTGNLDSKTTNVVCDIMFQVSRDLKSTFILVTHDRELALRADSQLLMSDGELTYA